MLKPQNPNATKSQGLFSPESTTLSGEESSELALEQRSSSHSISCEIQLQEAQVEEQQQLQQQHEDQKALQQAEKIAYNALSKREYSTQELEEKLLRKNTPIDIVKMVIRQVQDLNLQSDDRFTESFVRSRINRGQGPVRIEMELKQRGISTDLAEQHLAAEESFWLAQAKTLLARRGVGGPSSRVDVASPSSAEDFVDITDTTDTTEVMLEEERASDQESQWQAQQAQQKIRASHARFLASRGFRSNTISRALPEIFD